MNFIVGGMRQGPRVIALAVMAVGIAACSGDTTRFNDSPFPSREPEANGPVAAARAPVGGYEQQPLPPPQGNYGGNPNGYGGNYNGSPNGGDGGNYNGSPNNGNYNNGYGGTQNGGYGSPQNGNYGTPQNSNYGSPQNGNYGNGQSGNYYQSQSAAPAVAGGGRGMVSYAPANASPAYASGASPEYTGSVDVPPRPIALTPAPGPRSLAPASPPAPIPAMPAAGASVHVVVQGDTLYSMSRRYGRSVNEIAKANNMEQTTPLRIGARVTIPGTRTAQATLSPKSASPKSAQKLAQPKPLGSPAKLAAAQTTPTGIPAVPSPSAVAPKPPAPAKQQVAESSSGLGSGTGANTGSTANVMTQAPDGPALSGSSKPVAGSNKPVAGSSKPVAEAAPAFRWPVRGRVIEEFGPKANGQQNDGINLAVPEGTPVKAAEDGVVAYAGNELKGYGNLLLVRHSNGYVTAYAHSKELMVKRGEEVKRGQVIAKSGQTGNVDAPQLHFEVRKGQAPLNPIPMLTGG
jgi:murein DD-endopeptidase MepM/ murein hydrolase activator NlpD